MTEMGSLGLERGQVRVVSWNSHWPRLFLEAASEIRNAVGVHVLEIEHIGSTAVVGLSAKPLLDILVGVAEFDAALDLVPDLARLGYEHRPDEEIPDRHYFRRLVASGRTHHLSLAEPSSNYYRRTVGFRDALRGDAALRIAYEELKRDLAHRYPTDREQYLNGKTAFVLGVLDSHGYLEP